MLGQYEGRRVLVTGHTGFKGAWLCAWLKRAGAIVAGLALPPEPDRDNLYEAAAIGVGMVSAYGDIREYSTVLRIVEEFAPEFVFHLAAQALVRRSYRDPLRTFETNVLGTVHVLEAARQSESVRSIVCVTTDKVYENREWVWGYREDDSLGGNEPYSASKACAEIAAAAYRSSFFSTPNRVALATARGGNVVGGGDWSEDRLIPDVVRALIANEEIVLRNPRSVRPWQHVLELCNGYLQLGLRLLHAREAAVGAWNFGPRSDDAVAVARLVGDFCAAWGASPSQVRIEAASLKESATLRLDISKAVAKLDWNPLLDYRDTLQWTADWYRRYHQEKTPAATLVDEQLDAYAARMTA